MSCEIVKRFNFSNWLIDSFEFRNSKLTRLLSDSLGGNSKTLLIACIGKSNSINSNKKLPPKWIPYIDNSGPAKINLDESISTLRFACTTKRIKNRAKINEDAKDALLRKFQEQISELRRQLEEELQESEEQKVLHGNVERNAETKEGNKESGGKPLKLVNGIIHNDDQF